LIATTNKSQPVEDKQNAATSRITNTPTHEGLKNVFQLNYKNVARAKFCVASNKPLKIKKKNRA